MTAALPTLTLTGIANAATTYSFRGERLPGPHSCGWALCTVNDQTGELVITSDWGSWSYMWSAEPSHLGAASLTHFIGTRAGPDYLAAKLLGRRGHDRFSAPETTKHLRKLLCAARLADGRIDSARARFRSPFTRHHARALWDELGSLESDISPGDNESARTLYVERFMHLDDHELVTEEPWEETQTVESNASKILNGTILPALIAACRAHAEATPAYVALREAHEAACRAKAEADARARGLDPDAAVDP